uniref:Guanine nucleotide-binding protein subunit gamma 2 isoform X1 n=1 Tax=Rhizophora mucronata TaxID=61149 RepID=A0A2P2LZ81_RHIMU
MQSNRSDSSCPITRRVYSFTAASDLRGKHRVQAELKRLEQEAKSLENELEQLEKMESASAACMEYVRKMPSFPMLSSLNSRFHLIIHFFYQVYILFRNQITFYLSDC